MTGVTETAAIVAPIPLDGFSLMKPPPEPEIFTKLADVKSTAGDCKPDHHDGGAFEAKLPS
jgi:hypothetical protein